jgi:hypothetical protein
VGTTGFEQPAKPSGKTGVSEKTGVNSGAVSEFLATLTPEQRALWERMNRGH